MWEATIDGRPLHFRLTGINNQNFIMRDEETGSWWQQVSGECILGPLKGRRLNPVYHDEISFAVWKRERPQGRVLRPDERIASEGKYAPADWEQGMAKVPVITPTGAGGPFEPRTLIVGLTVNGESKAYPVEVLQRQNPIIDVVGGTAVLVVAGEDGNSVRAFDRTIDGQRVEFFVKPGTTPLRLVDAATGSEWDFAGTAIAGTLAGRQLTKIPILKDYWFDWKAYHPDTAAYRLGER